MKEILFFWGPQCPRCKDARKLIGWHRGVKVTRYDVSTADGLSEAAFYGMVSTPSIVILKDGPEVGVVIAKFDADNLPTREALKALLNGN
jgi:hypothetical protein